MIRQAVCSLICLSFTYSTTLAMSGATVRAVPPGGDSLQCVSISGGSLVWDSCNRKAFREVTGTDTALITDDVIILNSASNFTLNLFACSGNSGRQLILKNVNTGDVTVDGDGAEEIDGVTTLTMSMIYQSRTLYCNGTYWSVL